MTFVLILSAERSQILSHFNYATLCQHGVCPGWLKMQDLTMTNEVCVMLVSSRGGGAPPWSQSSLPAGNANTPAYYWPPRLTRIFQKNIQNAESLGRPGLYAYFRVSWLQTLQCV